MDEELRESYRTLENVSSIVTLNEPICPRFVFEFYHSLEVKINEEKHPYIEFKLGQFTFKLTLSQLSRILQTPYALETFYTSTWENFFCSFDKRNKVNACTAYMLYYLTIGRKFNFTSMIIYRMEEFINKRNGPVPFSMLLTRLYNHILTRNPQAIVPIARFTFHEHVMDLLDISRNPSKEKGKKIVSLSVISSSSSSSDDNEAPSFLMFYDELSGGKDLTKA
ncbi:hypothetical protein Tco_1497008 [Tanacetum coccineum]